MRRALFLLFASVASGCVPAPVPPPQPPDASDAAVLSPLGDSATAHADASPPMSPCQAACAALAAVGCHEGLAMNCVPVMAHMDGSGSSATPSGKPATCAAVALVRTVTEARAQLPKGACTP